jgi:hypothetical protein
VCALVICATLAGCGDEGGAAGPLTYTEPAKLSKQDYERIVRAQQAEHRFCRDVALSLSGDAEAPSERDYRRASRAIADLAALARVRPKERGPGGISPQLALSDMVEDVEGAHCDPRIIEQVNLALEGVPSS